MEPISSARLVTPAQLASRINIAMAGRGIEPHGRGSELARITGTSPQAASKWLTGQVMPSYSNILRIANRYKIEPGWLLTGEGDMYRDDDLIELHGYWRKLDQKGHTMIKTLARQLSESPLS